MVFIGGVFYPVILPGSFSQNISWSGSWNDWLVHSRSVISPPSCSQKVRRSKELADNYHQSRLWSGLGSFCYARLSKHDKTPPTYQMSTSVSLHPRNPHMLLKFHPKSFSTNHSAAVRDIFVSRTVSGATQVQLALFPLGQANKNLWNTVTRVHIICSNMLAVNTPSVLDKNVRFRMPRHAWKTLNMWSLFFYADYCPQHQDANWNTLFQLIKT